MKIEIPDNIVTMAMHVDALQANRTGVTTLPEFEDQLRKAKMISQLIGDEVASIILRNVRKSQGLPMFVPRKP